MSRVETIDIRQQDQEICLNHGRHLGTQGIVVSNLEFFNRNCIVLIDNRNSPSLQEDRQCLVGIFIATLVDKVILGQEDLGRYDVAYQ